MGVKGKEGKKVESAKRKRGLKGRHCLFSMEEDEGPSAPAGSGEHGAASSSSSSSSMALVPQQTTSDVKMMDVTQELDRFVDRMVTMFESRPESSSYDQWLQVHDKLEELAEAKGSKGALLFAAAVQKKKRVAARPFAQQMRGPERFSSILARRLPRAPWATGALSKVKNIHPSGSRFFFVD